MEILTLDDLRLRYGLSFPDSLSIQYQTMLDTAVEACLSYAGIEEGLVEEHFLDAGRTLHLTHAPIKDVVSVKASDEELPFRFDKRSSSVIISPYLARRTGEIVVAYNVGWAVVPASFKSAVALTVQHLSKLQNSKQMGVLSRTTEGGTEQIEQNIPPLAVKGLLDSFRSPGL